MLEMERHLVGRVKCIGVSSVAQGKRLKMTPMMNYKEPAVFQNEKNSSASHSFPELSSPKMSKSPSLQRENNSLVYRQSNSSYTSHESPIVQSPASNQMVENGAELKTQYSFEMRLPDLPKIEIHSLNRKFSNNSDPESPISPLLTSDPKNERSNSKIFSRPLDRFDDLPIVKKEFKDSDHQKPPSFWILHK